MAHTLSYAHFLHSEGWGGGVAEWKTEDKRQGENNKNLHIRGYKPVRGMSADQVTFISKKQVKLEQIRKVFISLQILWRQLGKKNKINKVSGCSLFAFILMPYYTFCHTSLQHTSTAVNNIFRTLWCASELPVTSLAPSVNLHLPVYVCTNLSVNIILNNNQIQNLGKFQPYETSSILVCPSSI